MGKPGSSDAETAGALAALRRLQLGVAVGIVVASFVAFSPVLDAGFVSWDDGLTVTDNFAVRGLDPERLRWMASTSHAGHYQPLSWLSLALDHARLGLTPPTFPEAAGFHATNLALHMLTALLLYALGLRVFGLATGVGSGLAGRDLALAVGFATLLHALHPLRCESVCWVTERRDVLSAPFFLLALLAYLRASPVGPVRAVRRGWLWASVLTSAGALGLATASLTLDDPERLRLAASGAPGLALAAALVFASVGCAARGVSSGLAAGRGVFLALALGCMLASLTAKAWGIVLPALMLLLDGWPLRRISRASWLAVVAEKLPFAVLSVIFAALARWAQIAQQGRLDVWGIHTLGDRVVQGLYGIAFYPAKTLWPFDLAPLYPIPDELSLGEPRFLLAAVLTLGVTALALGLRRSRPWLLAGWLGYLAIVSPVLGVQQSGPQLVADRYAYLAGIPLAWLLGGALWWALRRDPVTRRAGLIAAGLVLVGVATLTFRQSQIWRDSETLWTVAYAHAPEAPLASLNLGLAIADRARQMPDPELRARELDRALALVRAAAARRPSMGLYAMNEAILMSTRAQPPGGEVDSALLEQAIERGAAAIAVAEAQSLSDASWYWHQGRMLVASGRPEPAIHSFEQALSRRPDWPPARIALAGALLESALRSGEEDSERALLRVSRALGVLAPLPESTTDVQRLRAGALELRAVLIDERRGAHASPPGL